MPLLQAFQHPAVKIAVRLNDGFVDLLEQRIDVAVRLGELLDSSLLVRRIGMMPRWLVARRKPRAASKAMPIGALY